MQMVGATKSFIRKPFVMRSIKLGMLAGLAIIALIGVLLYVETSFPDLGIFDNKFYCSCFISRFRDCILITWLSSFCDTEILNLRTDDLY
jgi:cell division transport system permease protein